jgi:hypothetical protein
MGKIPVNRGLAVPLQSQLQVPKLLNLIPVERPRQLSTVNGD